MASILRINPVEHSLVIPNTGGDAKFNLAKLEWEASDFTVEISDSRQIGSSPDRSEVHFRSDVCLTVRYKTPKTTVEVLSELRALDDFLSVVSGSFVKLKAVWLEVLLNHPEENKAEFKLLGYDTGSIKDDFVARSEILAELPIKDNWAKRIENFLHEWLNNQIAFKWFRSSQTKRRYVEEVFFYAVRLTERYFKESILADAEAERALLTIKQRSNGDKFINDFVDRRLSPLFTRGPSLSTTLRTLFKSFPEIRAFSEIKPQRVAYLRGKEAHGADTNYTTDEYVDMDYLARSFLFAFRVSVLERCGFDRAAIFNRAESNKIRHLLSQKSAD